ncbi:hypothetical protein NW758_015021 [Fusarium oxysporum]|nr:hypothetical protein NW758_015021 [Fusarium oxysporum]
MKELDSVINRCEDMVRATSHNLLCWLLSSRLQSRREFGFKLVVERSSGIRYRRTQKQFLAFIRRIYRMPDNSRHEMVNVKMKPDIITQLHRIWEHSIGNYFDLTRGTWPVMEGQGSPLAGTSSSLIGGQFISGLSVIDRFRNTLNETATQRQKQVIMASRQAKTNTCIGLRTAKVVMAPSTILSLTGTRSDSSI